MGEQKKAPERFLQRLRSVDKTMRAIRQESIPIERELAGLQAKYMRQEARIKEIMVEIAKELDLPADIVIQDLSTGIVLQRGGTPVFETPSKGKRGLRIVQDLPEEAEEPEKKAQVQ